MIEIVAFMGGAIVMTLEIVGSRVVAPYLGTSTPVWTALIGVILASLSIGYWLGGKIADKNANPRVLAGIIALSGVFTGLIVYFREFLDLFEASAQMLPLASIAVAILLFTPATICLGMISPYVVRLRLTNVETSGATVGRLYALSTFGSIIGTFMGGFILISFIGTGKIILLLAITLFALSILVFFYKKSDWSIAAVAIIWALGISIAISMPASYFNETPDLIADLDTPYQRIWIKDGFLSGDPRPIRFLSSTEFVWQSAVDLANPTDLIFEYVKLFDLSLHFKPSTKKALLIGGGAFTYPVHFIDRVPEGSMDVVEIDKHFTKIAEEYFGFKHDPRITIINEDGRYFLNSAPDNTYDVVFLDAYTSYLSIPFQLASVESLERVDRTLTDDGIVVANVFAPLEGPDSDLFNAIVNTYRAVFPDVLVFKANPSIDPARGQNAVLVAFKASTTAQALTSADSVTQEYLDRVWRYETSFVPAITDELAPIERYVAKMIF